MIDCANSEIRDQLPELLAGGLTAAAAARVEEHVSTCSACGAELELLRVARRTFATRWEGVDTGRIVARIQPIRYRRSGWTAGQWRIAAGLLIAVVGAGAVGISRQRAEGPVEARDVAQQPPVASMPSNVHTAPAPPAPHDPAAVAPVPAEAVELAVAIPIAPLSDERLSALIASIENIQAIPLAEPQIRSIPVGSGAGPDSLVRTRDTSGGTR